MKYLVLACSLFLISCAAPVKKKEFNSLALGMTKAEVVKIMGEPDVVSAQKGGEFFRYRFSSMYLDLDDSHVNEYFVRFVDGKTESFGRMGDFDSTKPTTQKLIIEKESN